MPKVATSPKRRTSKKTGKVYYYDPEAAKRRRERLKEIIAAGRAALGLPPTPPRRPKGTGVGIYKESTKTGKKYYYIPWDRLTPEQKRARLEAAKRIRAEARAYREAKAKGLL